MSIASIYKSGSVTTGINLKIGSLAKSLESSKFDPPNTHYKKRHSDCLIKFEDVGDEIGKWHGHTTCSTIETDVTKSLGVSIMRRCL